VREKLMLYRAAVLKPVEGALTAEWRRQHPQTEPASDIFEAGQAGVLQDTGVAPGPLTDLRCVHGRSPAAFGEQLTLLLFLKMADQLTEEPYNRVPIVGLNSAGSPQVRLNAGPRGWTRAREPPPRLG